MQHKGLKGSRTLEALSLSAVLLLTWFAVYSPHLSYPYPFHADEWRHLGDGLRLASGQYGGEQSSSFESVYHAFLALLSLSGIDLVLAYRFLPAAFAVASALALYFFVRRISGSPLAAASSVAFFASLPSNTNLLGLWFATPLTFTIPLIYLFFTALDDAVESPSPRKAAIPLVLLAAMVASYPPSAALTASVAAIYLLLARRHVKWQPDIWRAAAPFAALVLVAVALAVALSGRSLDWMSSELLFRRGWTQIEPDYATNPAEIGIGPYTLRYSVHFVPVLFGLVPFALSMAGLYSAKDRRRLWVLWAWLLFSGALIALFAAFDISPLIPNQRAVYYCLLGLAPLAGIGFERLITWVLKRAKSPVWAYAAALMVLLATFYGYGNLPGGFRLYRLIGADDLPASQFLAAQPDGLVLSKLDVASALPAMTGKRVMADYSFAGDGMAKQAAQEFFKSGCDGKRQILDEYHIIYVYSSEAIDCPGINEEYSGKRYVYSHRLG